MDNCTISIVAINYNDPINFSLAVESLKRVYHHSKYQCQIITVDDGSDVPLSTQVEIPPHIHHVYKPRTEESSRAEARNYGASFCTNDIIVFVDGDGIVSSDIADQYRDHFTKYPDDVFAVGSALQYPTPPAIKPFLLGDSSISPMRYVDAILAQTQIEDMRGILCEDQYLDIPFRDLVSKWTLTYGCNLAIRRQQFIDVGGWDGAMKGWGAEDIELAYRVTKKYGHSYELCSQAKYYKPTDHYKGDEDYLNCITNMQYCHFKHQDPVWMDAMIFNNELFFDQYPVFETYSDFVRIFRNFEFKSRMYVNQ